MSKLAILEIMLLDKLSNKQRATSEVVNIFKPRIKKEIKKTKRE